MSFVPPVWGLIRHFTPGEFPHDSTKVDHRLLLALDAYREFVNRPVIIHVAWDNDDHVPGSQHYQGIAVDCHVIGMSLFEMWTAAERFQVFTGIGVYPYWDTPGLHLDIRSLPVPMTLNAGARWWRDAKGDYHSFQDGPMNLALVTRLLGLL